MNEVKLPLGSGMRSRLEAWCVRLDIAAAALSALSGGAGAAAKLGLKIVCEGMQSLLDADSEEYAGSVVRPLTDGSMSAPFAEYDSTMELGRRGPDQDGVGRDRLNENHIFNSPSAEKRESYKLLSQGKKKAAAAFKAGRKRKPRRRRRR